MSTRPHTIICFILLLLAAACNQAQQPAPQPATSEKPLDSMSGVEKAIAVVHPVNGSKVSGTVTFSKVDGGIRVEANLRGLTPGKHGFHIHEWGDCTAGDGTSAGGHFNPDTTRHGAPGDSLRHVGDLGNLIADDNGVAFYERVDSVIAFTGNHSIIGRGLIIHSGEDDLASQPTGNAGSRLGCGVIGIARPG